MISYSICQANKRHGSKSWYGRINDNGVVKYISLKTKRKADAQAWLDLMNAQRFLPESMQVRADKGPTFVKARNAFLDSMAATLGNDSLTLGAYVQEMRKITAFFNDKNIEYLMDFTKEHALEFASSLTNYASSTAREFIRLASQLFRFAADTYNLGAWNPMAKVKPPKLVVRAKDFWTPEQIDSILDHASTPEWRLLWSFMAFAGLRHSEACSMDSEHIKDGKIEVIGKGNKQAFLPINERLQAEIDKYGKGISTGMLDRSLYKASRTSGKYLNLAVKESGIKATGSITHHRFRHSFASNLIRAGVGVKHVSMLMRHADVGLTLSTYSHLLQEDLSEASNKIK